MRFDDAASPGLRPRTNFDTQLLKGVLGLLLLRLLKGREAYGYELVGEIRALGFGDISDGSVYPALARLERIGDLRSRLVPSSSGPARKYYRLSKRGLDALDEQVLAWRDLVAAVDPLLASASQHTEVQHQ
jgi:PadR family transcriptional regulator PadR